MKDHLLRVGWDLFTFVPDWFFSLIIDFFHPWCSRISCSMRQTCKNLSECDIIHKKWLTSGSNQIRSIHSPFFFFFCFTMVTTTELYCGRDFSISSPLLVIIYIFTIISSSICALYDTSELAFRMHLIFWIS